jgi:hypothetical protein
MQNSVPSDLEMRVNKLIHPDCDKSCPICYQGKAPRTSKRIQKLKAKLSELHSANESAWNTYGSELCGPAMLREENDLQEQIDVLEGHVLKCEWHVVLGLYGVFELLECTLHHHSKMHLKRSDHMEIEMYD